MEIPESRWKRVLGSPPQRIKVVQPRIVHGRNCERSICDPEDCEDCKKLVPKFESRPEGDIEPDPKEPE